MMTLQERFEEQKKRGMELQEELLRVQCEGDDKGFIYAGLMDFDFSNYWFKIDTFTADGRIRPHCFACKTLEDLKEAVRWILEDTTFTEVTAYVKGSSYVSFRNAEEIDLDFNEYYGI